MVGLVLWYCINYSIITLYRVGMLFWEVTFDMTLLILTFSYENYHQFVCAFVYGDTQCEGPAKQIGNRCLKEQVFAVALLLFIDHN